MRKAYALKNHIKAALTGGAIALTSSLSAGTETAEMEALRIQAETAGTVRIIVELTALDDTNEGTASGGVETAKTMLQSALPMDDAPVVEFIEDQPLMVMEVTAKGLAFLQTSPLVAGITLDEIVGVAPPIVEPIEEVSPEDDPPPTHSGTGTGDLSAPQN